MLLANFLSFSQIVQLPIETPFPYDSGVAMPLNTYRLLRLRTFKCDTLLFAKDSVIDVLERQDSLNQRRLENRATKISSLDSTIERKNSVLDSLREVSLECRTVLASSEPKKRWYERKETWLGSVVGFLIDRILWRL